MNGKRWKILLPVLALLLSVCSGFGTEEVYGADTVSEIEGWVQDDANLLTEEEEEALEQECERLAGEHQAGIYIITTEDFGGGDIKSWQRRIFDGYNLGEEYNGSGVLLAVSMAERDWGLVGFGRAQEAFSTYGRERIGELILDDLSDGEYYDAFARYLSISDDYFTAWEDGEPYTEERRYGERWRIPVVIGAAFLLSLAVSVAIVLSWKKSMNTRVRQSGAMAYLKPGSFRLQYQADQFLYHRVNRTKRQKESSSGNRGMHSDHSGTSGKF